MWRVFPLFEKLIHKKIWFIMILFKHKSIFISTYENVTIISSHLQWSWDHVTDPYGLRSRKLIIWLVLKIHTACGFGTNHNEVTWLSIMFASLLKRKSYLIYQICVLIHQRWTWYHSPTHFWWVSLKHFILDHV